MLDYRSGVVGRALLGECPSGPRRQGTMELCDGWCGILLPRRLLGRGDGVCRVIRLQGLRVGTGV